MKPYIWYQGALQNLESVPAESMSRAARYGDGILETLRIRSGKILFPELHWKRMKVGMQALQVKCNEFQDYNEWLSILQEVLLRNDISKGAKLKVHLGRKGTGLDLPLSFDADMLVSCESLLQNTYSVKTPKKAGISKNIQIIPSVLTRFKAANRLPYIIAALEAHTSHWEDALILNHKENVADSISANVWCLLPDGRLITPPESEGALPGVLKTVLFPLLIQKGYQVMESALSIELLSQSLQLILTNVISGPVPIEYLYLPDKRVIQYKTGLSENFRQILEESINNEL